MYLALVENDAMGKVVLRGGRRLKLTKNTDFLSI